MCQCVSVARVCRVLKRGPWLGRPVDDCKCKRRVSERAKKRTSRSSSSTKGRPARWLAGSLLVAVSTPTQRDQHRASVSHLSFDFISVQWALTRPPARSREERPQNWRASERASKQESVQKPRGRERARVRLREDCAPLLIIVRRQISAQHCPAVRCGGRASATIRSRHNHLEFSIHFI